MKKYLYLSILATSLIGATIIHIAARIIDGKIKNDLLADKESPDA